MSGSVSGDNADRNSLQRVGSFRFFYEGERWEWSDEVAALHGYQPGEVHPTTELMAQHKHPDDRAKFEAMVAEMLTNHAPFSSVHRIVDTRGHTHRVAVVAHSIRDATGTAIGTEGFYLDLAESIDETVSEQVQRFRERSGSIEQAKGMLMLIYGVDEDRAFDVLTWRSQHDNVKLRDVATSIVNAAVGMDIPERIRRDFDQIVLTATDDRRRA